MNKAESERLSSYFDRLDYQPAETAEEADLILLNSCVVRQNAENRVVNRLNALKSLKTERPGMILAVTGCLVNSEADHLKKKFPYVDYFFKPGDYPPWLETAGAAPVLPLRPSPSVYVPIIQGCNNFCSYCIVPYRRGRERSRPVREITCEVAELVQRGAREVILLGQNVDSYGHDLPDQPTLPELLAELNDIADLARIRFLTNHPKDMSQKLIKAVATLDKVCEQLTLPVQSGSNAILKTMRRDYTVEQYRELVSRIRSSVPGIALSTDIIVGFPSESESQFQETAGLLSEIKFDTVHVAAYSPRTGTIAAREFEDNVPPEDKKNRVNTVEHLQESIATEINSRLPGETLEVLVEGRDKGKWRGRTRTDKLVFFPGADNCVGQLINVKINKSSPWSLQGNQEPG